MSSSNKRSVRFTESSSGDHQPPPVKKSRPENNNLKPASVLRPSSHEVKCNNSNNRKSNLDELDDIDDWNEHDDGDPSNDGLVPSHSELIEAKRKRREQRSTQFDDDDHMDADDREKSLAGEGVTIEPFHMRDEETDGKGYFDGDTYVFRKNADGEADAWADTLEDGNEGSIATNIRRPPKATTTMTTQLDLDGFPKEELYKRILPLLGDSRETIMQAIGRYGRLANAKKHKKKPPQQATTSETKSTTVAKSHLDHLTGAANALLLKGEVDIYDTTRLGIFRKFPSLSSTFLEKSSNNNGSAVPVTTSIANWEYQGNEDGQLHMVTTKQMIGWIRSGYFVGAQRVKIRTVVVQEQQEKPQPLSTQDDMLADLMDDDDEEEEECRPSKKAKESGSSITVKGEWMWSDEVDYQKYL